jgi:diguanylate cyclase
VLKGSIEALDYIIQLGLNKLRKSDSKDPVVQAVWLIDQLLGLIEENIADDDASAGSFRFRLEAIRREILSVGKNELSGQTALNTLDLCRGQFRQLHSKYHEREEHLAEIIAFLRKALADIAGDSKTFHDDLRESTGRIQCFVELEDIRELKSRITNEVRQLNEAITEKQKREKIQFSQLSEQVSVLQRKLDMAKVEASLDGLTGIANRRNFDFTIQRWVIAHEKSEDPFTVAIIDLDNFKNVNDNYGHQIGDQVLIAAAMELGRNIRTNDFLARYGGEEFIILSEGMKLQESEKRYSALMEKIENMRFDCRSAEQGELSVSLTASCGVAEYALGETPRELIRRADEALYEAKRAGKNRVVARRRPLMSAYYEGRRRNSIA